MQAVLPLSIRRIGRPVLLLLASLLLAAYVLAPVAWLVSSSFQSEAEITSVPPHWIPHQPTVQNFAAIFKAKEAVVTYENRKQGDTATGGFIPSTAANLLPGMWNSLIVAVVGRRAEPAGERAGRLRAGQDPLHRALQLDLLHADVAGDPGHRAGGAVLPVRAEAGPDGQPAVARHHLPGDHRFPSASSS